MIGHTEFTDTPFFFTMFPDSFLSLRDSTVAKGDKWIDIIAVDAALKKRSVEDEKAD